MNLGPLKALAYLGLGSLVVLGSLYLDHSDALGAVWTKLHQQNDKGLVYAEQPRQCWVTADETTVEVSCPPETTTVDRAFITGQINRKLSSTLFLKEDLSFQVLCFYIVTEGGEILEDQGFICP